MSLRKVFRCGLLAALFALLSLPAAAQQRDQRGYVIGLGGVGATEVTSALFGGSAGFNVTPDLLITVDIGRTEDVLATFTEDDLAAVDQAVLAEGAPSSSSTVKMPTNYLTAGIRYLLPISGAFRPYVSAGGGIAHMSPKARFVIAGIDATSAMYEFEVVSNTFREDTRPTASVGGGIAMTVARHLTFDLGYRYSPIFIERDYLQDYEVSPHSHNRIDTHKVYAGVGFAF
jgi:opacity protein-like surface antigen